MIRNLRCAKTSVIRSAIFAVSLLVLLSSTARAAPVIQNVRFGILRAVESDYEIAEDTTRIPMRFKKTGFRFGISFENPTCAEIAWYEVIHLPGEMKATSGALKRLEPRLLKGDIQQSRQPYIVDQFWFDKGDPLGTHRLDLYVNNRLEFSVEFDVVKP